MVSSVAQGKKPATSATTTAPTSSRKTSASHPPASTATTKPTSGRAEHQTTRQPQKRVLPSRSRRGGPGFGSADVDAIILDAQKRKYEQDPLVSSNVALVLTTNAKLLPSSKSTSVTAVASSSAITLDDTATHARDGPDIENKGYERYFDRPEVTAAYKKQQLIETPEFSQLSEDAIVGSRFRPRATFEENLADTLDATYEKRHRKYETFEKRQRLREKEKLKHEQYKLKERIEQLRGMDGSAFLTLPVSLFRPPGTSTSQEGDGSVNEPIVVDDDIDTGLQDLPGIHVNGAALYNEGERRRREILETAAGLEERYRVLLPPDKVVKELTSASVGGSRRPSASVEPEAAGEEEAAQPPQQPQQKLKLRIKFPLQGSQVTNGNGDGVIPVSVPEQPQTQIQTQIPMSEYHPRRASTRGAGAVPKTPVLPGTRPRTRTSITGTPSVVDLESPRPNKRPRRGVRAQEVEDEDVVDTGEEVELPSPASIATSHKSHLKPHYPHHAHNQPTGILMATALRSSSLTSHRTTQRTQRHLTAFGLKIHPEVEEIRDFEIPSWLKEERLEMLMAQEPDGEFGEFGGAGEFAESVNGHENSVRASASEFGGGSVAGGRSIMGGGEGVEGLGGDGSQYGSGSLDVGVGSMVGISASQPSEIVSTSEPAEMEMLL
ncbi:hypothetical protein BDM02DRAFT_3187960 [Thelephora ganbajun]|uniref:Uncharacterized protein n=1 Tax=Thelephora ganbajun TaxID=370292 RepID=A0ACB6ZDN0_THEGA|nr:hypothetical protein BDM02DRAFT_3187960 [Thelephora ganbajun]